MLGKFLIGLRWLLEVLLIPLCIGFGTIYIESSLSQSANYNFYIQLIVENVNKDSPTEKLDAIFALIDNSGFDEEEMEDLRSMTHKLSGNRLK